MYKSSLAMAVALGVLAQQAGAAGFVEDSKLSVSSRTMCTASCSRPKTCVCCRKRLTAACRPGP